MSNGRLVGTVGPIAISAIDCALYDAQVSPESPRLI